MAAEPAVPVTAPDKAPDSAPAGAPALSFAGDRVVVTGAGDSVGRVIAERFLAAGAAVHICDVRPEAVAATLAASPGLRGTVGSVGDRADVERIFAEARAWMDPVTILVNVVGIGGPRGAMEEIDLDAWDETLRVNLSGAFHCMRQVIPGMKRLGRGAIVNFSTGSTRTRLPLRAAYVASKAGLEGLTLNAARELGPYNIRVNAILPGMIDNARMRGIVRANAEAAGRTPEEVEADYLRYISMRAKIDPAELADAVLFLASPQARHVTGELLAVSGGVEWEI